MKIQASTLILFFIISGCNLNSKLDQWINFEYDNASLYLYRLKNDPNKDRPDEDIVIDNKLNPSVIKSSEIRLTKEDIEELNSIMSGRLFTLFSSKVSECYEPHHGIVFFKDGIPVADISICIMCNRLKANPQSDIKAMDLEEFILEKGLPVFKNFTELREYINKHEL